MINRVEIVGAIESFGRETAGGGLVFHVLVDGADSKLPAVVPCVVDGPRRRIIDRCREGRRVCLWGTLVNLERGRLGMEVRWIELCGGNTAAGGE